MRRYKLYIFDMDGTLFRGEQPIAKAPETVHALRACGAKVRFLTNNSGQTRQFYQDKLERLGFEPSPSEIYSSAIGAAKLCSEGGIQTIFYVGEPGLRQTLVDAGVAVVNVADEASGQAQAVVAGICRAYTYKWMDSALQQIVNGAKFIATNTDATYPIEDGHVQPGAGAIVASIRTCSGQEPQIIGKPNPMLIEMVLEDAGVAPEDALAVGDRYDTDILSGVNAGVDTHLVLTGVTKTAPEGQRFSEDLSALLC